MGGMLAEGVVVRVLIASAEAGSDFDWFGKLSTWGPAGVVLAMVIAGVLVPKWAYDSIKADRDYWRASSEGKDAAIQTHREATEAANKRADTSQEAVSTTLRLLESLGHRSSSTDRSPP